LQQGISRWRRFHSLATWRAPAVHKHVTLFERLRVIQWGETGFAEPRVCVWWDYNHDRHPRRDFERFSSSEPVADRVQWHLFVGAIACGWLERLRGPYLVGGKGDRLPYQYVRHADRELLASMPKVAPLGYRATGKPTHV
jgi:hypothetical protein